MVQCYYEYWSLKSEFQSHWKPQLNLWLFMRCVVDCALRIAHGTLHCTLHIAHWCFFLVIRVSGPLRWGRIIASKVLIMMMASGSTWACSVPHALDLTHRFSSKHLTVRPNCVMIEYVMFDCNSCDFWGCHFLTVSDWRPGRRIPPTFGDHCHDGGQCSFFWPPSSCRASSFADCVWLAMGPWLVCSAAVQRWRPNPALNNWQNRAGS